MPSSVPPVFAPRWGNKPVVVWLHKMNRVGQNCSSFEQMRVCKKKINFLFRRSHSERFERGLLLLCANCVCVFCPYHWSNPPTLLPDPDSRVYSSDDDAVTPQAKGASHATTFFVMSSWQIFCEHLKFNAGCRSEETKPFKLGSSVKILNWRTATMDLDTQVVMFSADYFLARNRRRCVLDRSCCFD